MLQKTSLDANRKDVYAERKRQGIDPKEIAALQRKKADALFNLAKADAAEDGDDFERKRAWDWTVEESERWDKRVEKKKKRADDVAFQGKYPVCRLERQVWAIIDIDIRLHPER